MTTLATDLDLTPETPAAWPAGPALRRRNRHRNHHDRQTPPGEPTVIDLARVHGEATLEAAHQSWARSEELIADYLATPGVRTGKDVISRLRKYAYWLATGRMPVRVGRYRQLDFSITETATGHRPRSLDQGADEATAAAYRSALEDAKIAPAGRVRDVGIVAGFYTWHTGQEDNPAAQMRTVLSEEVARGPGNADHDRSYTRRQQARLLSASAELVTEAWHAAGQRFTVAVLKAWVEHTIVWLLWGTGAAYTALLTLEVDDIDLEARRITWRNGLLPAAGRGTDNHHQQIVRPIPATLVTVLAFYLSHIRPRIGSTSRRLLLNPHSKHPEKVLSDKVITRLTAKLAAHAGVEAEEHTPGQWSRSYAHRLQEDSHGSLITVTRMQNRQSFSGTARSYRGLVNQRISPSIDDVFGPESLWSWT